MATIITSIWYGGAATLLQLSSGKYDHLEHIHTLAVTGPSLWSVQLPTCCPQAERLCRCNSQQSTTLQCAVIRWLTQEPSCLWMIGQRGYQQNSHDSYQSYVLSVIHSLYPSKFTCMFMTDQYCLYNSFKI